jgi:hypothetical protein
MIESVRVRLILWALTVTLVFAGAVAVQYLFTH